MIVGLLISMLIIDARQRHAVFGAFLFGMMCPRKEKLTATLKRHIEPLAIILLIPFSFALAGLCKTTATCAAGQLSAR